MNKDNYKYCTQCKETLVEKKTPGDEHTRKVCPGCNHFYFSNPTPTVLAVIQRGNEILLTKRGKNPFKGYWDLPGGFVESGQNLEEALKSELKEELGITKTNIITYLGSYKSSYPLKEFLEDIVGVAFTVEIPENQNITPGSDVVEAKWFNLSKLPTIAPFDDVTDIIKTILNK